MARAANTIEININLAVDERTAETCLRLVEMYINSAPVKLAVNRTGNGETELKYEPIVGCDLD